MYLGDLSHINLTPVLYGPIQGHITAETFCNCSTAQSYRICCEFTNNFFTFIQKLACSYLQFIFIALLRLNLYLFPSQAQNYFWSSRSIVVCLFCARASNICPMSFTVIIKKCPSHFCYLSVYSVNTTKMQACMYESKYKPTLKVIKSARSITCRASILIP